MGRRSQMAWSGRLRRWRRSRTPTLLPGGESARLGISQATADMGWGLGCGYFITSVYIDRLNFELSLSYLPPVRKPKINDVSPVPVPGHVAQLLPTFVVPFHTNLNLDNDSEQDSHSPTTRRRVAARLPALTRRTVHSRPRNFPRCKSQPRCLLTHFLDLGKYILDALVVARSIKMERLEGLWKHASRSFLGNGEPRQGGMERSECDISPFLTALIRTTSRFRGYPSCTP